MITIYLVSKVEIVKGTGWDDIDELIENENKTFYQKESDLKKIRKYIKQFEDSSKNTK